MRARQNSEDKFHDEIVHEMKDHDQLGQIGFSL